MRENNIIAILNIAIRAARKAGITLIKGFEEINNNNNFHLMNEFYKNEFIKKIHELAENDITKIIGISYPLHSVSFKRINKKLNTNHIEWIINTISGTYNYMQGFPHFAMSIAIKIKKITEIAIIYDVLKNELFSAIRGYNAQINGYRLRVKENKKNQFIALNNMSLQNNKILMFIRNNDMNIRFTGSPSLDLAYLSAGRINAYINNNINVWDLAAGSLLIRESGGILTDFDGSNNYEQSKSIVAGHINTVKKILIRIKNYKYST